MKKFMTAFALTISLAPMAFAQSAQAPARGHVRAHAMTAAFKKLKLTADQKTRIKAIRQADRQQNQALYESFRARVAELRQLKQSNDPKFADAKTALQPLAAQVKAARKATREQILTVLTPVQRAELKAVSAQAQLRREVLKSLNLTADQKAQIKAIRQADRQQNATLYQSFRAEAKQYRALKRANDPEAAAAKTQLLALRDQVRAARAATHQKVLGVFTPEQRAQLQRLRGNK